MNSYRKLRFIILCIIIYNGTLMGSSSPLPRQTATQTALPNTYNLKNVHVDKPSIEGALSFLQEEENRHDTFDINRHANQLIKQNYKTLEMRYHILLLMNTNPFMIINTISGYVENLPDVHEIINKTTTNQDRDVSIQALKTCLKAINGAIADAQYDANTVFTTPDIVKTLKKMGVRISTQLEILSPVNWLKYSVPLILASVATGTGLYYSGITMQDINDFLKKSLNNSFARY